jgi:geranylgeranyl pyrophosphate synthase/predicted secreted hydrolase
MVFSPVSPALENRQKGEGLIVCAYNIPPMRSGSADNRHGGPVHAGKYPGRVRITSREPGEGTSETFHPGSAIEWWFVHGSFEGKTCGRRSFMTSLFRQDRPKTSDPDPPGYYLIASLLDTASGRTWVLSRGERAVIDTMFSEIRNRKSTNIEPRILDAYFEELRSGGPVPPVTLEQDRPEITGEPFSAAWKDYSFSQEGDQFRLTFTFPGGTARCSFLLRPLSPRHEMHGIGATQKFPMAYATIPRLALEGTFEGETVSGEAWFDHQWGSACWFLTDPSGGRLNGWDWIAINGNDGSDWIFLLFHDMKTKRIIGRFAVRYMPDEKPRIFRNFEAVPVRFWESKTTHIMYPVSWILKIPEISAEISVNPTHDEQEIPVLGFMRAVWEGAATASGIVEKRPFSGSARLELQGYGYIFDFREFLGPYIKRIQEDIGTFLPRTIDPARYQDLAGSPRWVHEQAACNETIAQPFWDLMSRKKKYWRPVFGMLLLESLGISLEKYRMLIAVVPELTHSGTLIIDDIEDNATTRRGDTCIHNRYGIDIAINAANTLYFLPAALFSSHPHLTDSQRLEFYRKTFDGFVRGHLGQALDIYWTRNLSQKNLACWRADHLPEKMLQMYEFKTASPAIVVADACCTLAGSDERTRTACRDFAQSIGVSFQILNDVNNFNKMQAVRQDDGDLASGKLTYVIVRALERLGERDQKRLVKILCTKRLRRNPECIREGIRLIRKSGALGVCRKEALAMVEEGWRVCAPRIPPSEHKLMLRLFSQTLFDNKRKNRSSGFG